MFPPEGRRLFPQAMKIFDQCGVVSVRCPGHKTYDICTRDFETGLQFFFFNYDITQSVVIVHLFEYTLVNHY